jgi:hypothetical protein
VAESTPRDQTEDFAPLDEEASPIDEEVSLKAEPSEPAAAFAVIEESTPPVVDPMGAIVRDRLDQLFILGEFGLAFHLAAATRQLMPELDVAYDPLEFRLAAAAGRFSGLSGQDIEGLFEARNQARAVAQAFEVNEDARSIARRTMLLAGAIPAALFRPDDTGAAGLVGQIGAAGFTSPFFQLVEAVEENRKRGYPITAANLAAAAISADEKSFIEGSLKRIAETIDSSIAAGTIR